MTQSHQKKNSSYSHSTEKNCTDSKFPKQSLSQVEKDQKLAWGLSTQFSTPLSESSSSNLDGEMSEQSAAVPVVVTTDSQEAENALSRTCKHSEVTYKHGNPRKTLQSLNLVAQNLAVEKYKIRLRQDSEHLAREQRKYSKIHTAVTRYLSVPVACLFPEDRREEWLGDLYEVNWQLLSEEYPIIVINVIDAAKTIVLITSALQIKFMDLIPFVSQKIK